MGGSQTPPFVTELVRRVRASLLPPSPAPGRSWTITEIRAEERAEARWDLVILFRDATRPKCLFGFRFGDLGRWQRMVPEVGPLANICVANLEESIEAGDSRLADVDCSPDEIAWI
jgi:hypothetical protein